MDNTELHYVTYDPTELWNAMMDAYIEAGGDILYPGDEKEILMRGVQSIVTQAFAGVDNALRMQTLRYAVRDYLDMIGELRSCARITATAAIATVTITTNATGQADTLRANTGMTADGEVYYRLTEDVALSGHAETISASIICDRTGAVGNGLLVGTEMHMEIPDPNVNSIVVTVAAAGGQDEETDETYRERIRMKGLVSVTTGTEENYRSAAMAVSSMILDARPLAAADMSVCVYLLLSDDTGAAGIIAAVEAALSARDARPLTDHVSATLATKVSYSLEVEYGVPAGAGIESAVAAAVEEYTAWQNRSIGRAFDPDKLKVLLYQAGATRVIFGENSEFDGGSTIEYTEIEANEVCSGTVTTAVMES